MFSNRLAFATLGFACVVAAAGGSYVATRHNAVDQFAAPANAAAAVTTPAGGQDAPTTATAAPVAVTEAVPAARPAEPVPAIARSIAPTPTSRTAQPARGATATSATKRSVSEPPASARVAQRVEPSSAPSETNSPAGNVASVPVEPPASAQRQEERVAEVPAVQAPPPATFQELVVAADSVIGLQAETTLSSERARIEDRVEARVVRDLRVGGRVAIPAGTRALGSVVVVERGGKLKERARLGIRFHTLAMADGTRLPISTETIYRYGDAPGDASAKKIGGGAVAGAILGAILGGGKGAAIGATAGAAGGGAVVMNGDRSEAVFASGAEVTARIVSPVTVTVER